MRSIGFGCGGKKLECKRAALQLERLPTRSLQLAVASVTDPGCNGAAESGNHFPPMH